MDRGQEPGRADDRDLRFLRQRAVVLSHHTVVYLRIDLSEDRDDIDYAWTLPMILGMKISGGGKTIRRLVDQTGRAQVQKEVVMNFHTLHVRASERGWTLSKSTEVARFGTMPIRYTLKDHKGLMHFRNLEEVERRLNAKAKNREPASLITPAN